MTVDRPHHMIEQHIGQKVFLPGVPTQGILRYVGEIEGKSGTFCGLELLGPMATLKGKNSGGVDGKQYFEVKVPQTGLFVPIDRLKAANPQLNRPPSRRSSAITPQTPGRISSSSGGTAGNGSGSISNSGSPKIGIPSSASSYGIPTNRSRPSSRLLSSELVRRSLVQPADAAHLSVQKDTLELETRLRNLSISKDTLERELESLKSEHRRNLAEMKDKMSILHELQGTVELLQPLLENYERELAEKDARISKQRGEFERAREEWRESLDVLANTQQEAEQYYENEIELLIKKVAELKESSGSKSKEMSANLHSDEGSKGDIELQRALDDITMEKMILEKQLNAKISSQEIEIRKLKKQQTEQAQEVQLPKEREDEVSEKEKTIEELRKAIDTLKAQLHQNQTNSSETVDKLVVSKLEQTVKELNSQNLALTSHLAVLESSASNTQKSLQLKVDTLSEELLRNQKLVHENGGVLDAYSELSSKNKDLDQRLAEIIATNRELKEKLAQQDKTVIAQQELLSSLEQLKATGASNQEHISSLNEIIKDLSGQNKQLREKEEVAIKASAHSDQLQKELQQLTEKYAQKEQAVLSLQKDYDISLGTIAQHEKTIAEHEVSSKRLMEDHTERNKALKADYEIEIGILCTEHKKSQDELKALMDSIKTGHQSELKALKKSHVVALENKGGDFDTLRAEHQRDVDAVSSRHDSEIEKICKAHALELEEQKANISNIQKTHRQELNSVKEEYEAKLEALKSGHSLFIKNIREERNVSTTNLNEQIHLLRDENLKLTNFQKESIQKHEAFKLTSESQFKDYEKTILSKDSFIEELQNKHDTQLANFASSEITKLQDEITSLKEKHEANPELSDLIEQLKHELEMRPTFDELASLQKSIEELESLHLSEVKMKDEELKDVAHQKQELELELEITRTELDRLKTEIEESFTQNENRSYANINKDATINTTESTTNLGLPIYTPNAPTDPSLGKEKWCGLCERDGHDSLHCPFENDMF